MRTGRLEAFSDGVIAILITIMVLELPKPANADWLGLRNDLPVLVAYLLSFVYIGVYWNNHHHLFQAVGRIRGGVLWANLHLLFWLSLVPFSTGWIAESWTEWANRPAEDAAEPFPVAPVVFYGVLLLGAGTAYWILQSTLIRAEGSESRLARAVGRDLKGKSSMPLYLIGIVLSVVNPWVGLAVYAAVALLWFIPDRRVERLLEREGQPAEDRAGA